MKLKLVIKQGNAGMWRWQLWRGATLVAMPPVRAGMASAELSLEQTPAELANVMRPFGRLRAKRIPYEFVRHE